MENINIKIYVKTKKIKDMTKEEKSEYIHYYRLRWLKRMMIEDPEKYARFKENEKFNRQRVLSRDPDYFRVKQREFKQRAKEKRLMSA